MAEPLAMAGQRLILSNTFRQGHEGRALKAFLACLRGYGAPLTFLAHPPEMVSLPGVEVYIIPPGIRLLYQHAIHVDAVLGRFDVLVSHEGQAQEG